MRCKHGDDVPEGHHVLYFERRKGIRHDVETVPVTLEGLERLVGPRKKALHRHKRALLFTPVNRNDRPVFGHGDDGHVQRTGHPFGGAVARPRFGGGYCRVGHQVDVGPGDPARVVRQDDRPVHLRELGEPLRAELGVEQEPPGADREDLRAVPNQDESSHVGLEDAVQPFAQRPAWGN